MLNPLNSSQAPLSSRLALSGALLLAGVFGLAAALIVPPGTSIDSKPLASEMEARHANERSNTPLADGESVPSPSASELVRFCSQNVTLKRSFVLFRRGTCVIVDEPCEDPLAEALRKLSTCAEAEARFLSEPTAEGDLIVTFKEPVFQRFNRDELNELSRWVENAAPALLTPAEALQAGDGWSPGRNARFGLLARRRLLEDAAEAKPVRIIRAKNAAVATN